MQAHTKKFDLLKIRAKSLKIRQRQLQMRLNDEIRLKMNTGARPDKLKIVFLADTPTILKFCLVSERFVPTLLCGLVFIFFLREKFVTGLAHKNFSNNFDEIRAKFLRTTMNFPATTPIQPHSVLSMYVFI